MSQPCDCQCAIQRCALSESSGWKVAAVMEERPSRLRMPTSGQGDRPRKSRRKLIASSPAVSDISERELRLASATDPVSPASWLLLGAGFLMPSMSSLHRSPCTHGGSALPSDDLFKPPHPEAAELGRPGE